MSAEEIAKFRKRITAIKSERDQRVGKIDQAKQEIQNTLTELATMGLTEKELDTKIQTLTDKEQKSKEILNKKITECEKLIRKE